MTQTQSQQQSAIAGDNRTGSDRRDDADRRQASTDWPGEDRRHAEDRRSWVGRRQAAEWRRR